MIIKNITFRTDMWAMLFFQLEYRTTKPHSAHISSKIILYYMYSAKRIGNQQICSTCQIKSKKSCWIYLRQLVMIMQNLHRNMFGKNKNKLWLWYRNNIIQQKHSCKIYLLFVATKNSALVNQRTIMHK